MGDLSFSIATVGLVVGFLIGLSGMGGGAILDPILIFLLGTRPTIAVGTSLVYSAVTKLFGAWVHIKQKTVDLKIALTLAAGSLPSALVGVYLVHWLKQYRIDMVEAVVMKALGYTLIFVSVVLLVEGFLFKRLRERSAPLSHGTQRGLTFLAGCVVGFLVGMTSVGSGTLIVMCLLLLYPALPARTIVGTDVLNGAVLVATAGTAHYWSGNVDMGLVLNLLVGSLPGVIIGSKLSARCPDRLMRPVLASLLIAAGIKLV